MSTPNPDPFANADWMKHLLEAREALENEKSQRIDDLAADLRKQFGDKIPAWQVARIMAKTNGSIVWSELQQRGFTQDRFDTLAPEDRGQSLALAMGFGTLIELKEITTFHVRPTEANLAAYDAFLTQVKVLNRRHALKLETLAREFFGDDVRTPEEIAAELDILDAKTAARRKESKPKA